MSLNGLKLRTVVINQVRNYLAANGFEELEPQLFAPADTLEPTLYPFKVGDYYLPTSPEAFLKQAIAQGAGNCFAISHAFRNLEGQGRLHNPEFIMVEWYRQGADYQQMIVFTQELVNSILSLSSSPWLILSWRDLWQQVLPTPLDSLIDPAAMVEFAQSLDLNVTDATWEQLFNQIADIYLVPKFPREPFFLIDYPARISPLAAPRIDLPAYAQRFELFIHGIELANGNTELFDAASVQAIMELEQRSRPQASSLYRQFIHALQQLEGQQWSGVGLGLDRLAMLKSSASHLDQVQTLKNFP